MKIQTTKLMALVILVLLTYDVKAQFLVGGTASITNSNISVNDVEQSNNSIVFAPQIGIALKPMHLLGFRYSYSKSKRETLADVLETTNSIYTIFSRHRKSLNKSLNVYGEVALNFINSQDGNTGIPIGTTNIRTQTSYGISLAPGLEFKFAEKWLLNAQWGILSYSHTVDNSIPDVRKSNTFDASLQTDNIFIGISYLFNLKQEASE